MIDLAGLAHRDSQKGMARCTKSSQNTRKKSMRTWRRRQETQTVYISVNNNTNVNFVRFFLSTLFGMD
jgi:hypothetical protein